MHKLVRWDVERPQSGFPASPSRLPRALRPPPVATNASRQSSTLHAFHVPMGRGLPKNRFQPEFVPVDRRKNGFSASRDGKWLDYSVPRMVRGRATSIRGIAPIQAAGAQFRGPRRPCRARPEKKVRALWRGTSKRIGDGLPHIGAFALTDRRRERAVKRPRSTSNGTYQKVSIRNFNSICCRAARLTNHVSAPAPANSLTCSG